MRDEFISKNIFDELAKNWFTKANEDLLWAKATFKESFYSSACFVAQQAVEKSLKAYLFSKKQKLIKTHILPRLLKSCMLFDKEFKKLKNACEILSLYYTESRYPDDVDTLIFNTRDKAREAIDLAAKVIEFVAKRIKI